MARKQLSKKPAKVRTSVVLRRELFAHVNSRAIFEQRSRNWIIERAIERDLQREAQEVAA